MTPLVEGIKQAIGRKVDVGDRVAALEQAVAAARGRLDDELVDAADDVVRRTGQRLRLAPDHTVVALAGSTGSGKSSLFNALAGLDLAAVGVRRPTTSWALACTWGASGAEELLDWLRIPSRHRITRDSLLDAHGAQAELAGLVLLDLPDHDSTEVEHHLEVDRLVALVDQIVWVVDPQKYADAVLHRRYLQPLAAHSDVMMIVLNHVDRLDARQRADCLADLHRLLDRDGLGSVPVLATSATRGDGLDELRADLATVVRAKRAATARLVADVRGAARALGERTGTAEPTAVSRSAMTELENACAAAAGVPVVVDAVRRATTVRARAATGWPVTRWLVKVRPDPLRRLHLDIGRSGGTPAGSLGDDALRSAGSAARASLPAPTRVQRARVDSAVRRLVEDAATDLPGPWAAAVRRASVARLDDIGDALDRAVVSTDLGVSRTPVWWRLVRLLQWVLLAAALAGGLWLLALFGFGYLRLPEPPTPEWHGFAVPTVLLVGGVVAGLLVALLCRGVVVIGARRRARRVDRRLRAGITEVVRQHVVEPVDDELNAYRACRDAIAIAAAR